MPPTHTDTRLTVLYLTSQQGKKQLTKEPKMFGATHFLPTGYSTEFICGSNAVGRRSTREQMNPANTTCAKCQATEFWQEIAAESGVEYTAPAPATPAGPCGNRTHKHHPIHALAA